MSRFRTLRNYRAAQHNFTFSPTRVWWSFFFLELLFRAYLYYGTSRLFSWIRNHTKSHNTNIIFKVANHPQNFGKRGLALEAVSFCVRLVLRWREGRREAVLNANSYGSTTVQYNKNKGGVAWRETWECGAVRGTQLCAGSNNGATTTTKI